VLLLRATVLKRDPSAVSAELFSVESPPRRRILQHWPYSPTTDSAPYVASKHGVIDLTKVAAEEIEKGDVRVNVVAP
jgi:NAD(P)-dependent dehydrogenase (short-subunit alcohol dehydrogenase family)